METIEFTYQELRDFIFSQPDEKKVNMNEAGIGPNRECGCVLAQFADFRVPRTVSNNVGLSKIWVTKRGGEVLLEGDSKICNLVKYLIDNTKETIYDNIKSLVLEFEAKQS